MSCSQDIPWFSIHPTAGKVIPRHSFMSRDMDMRHETWDLRTHTSQSLRHLYELWFEKLENTIGQARYTLILHTSHSWLGYLSIFKGNICIPKKKKFMSHPNSLAINPLSLSRLPQQNIVQDLIVMNVLNEIALEWKKLAFLVLFA
jgi:hypothetical protein